MDDTPAQGVSGSETDRAVEAQILELLAQRGPGKTICPSEVARALYRRPLPGASGDDQTVAGWRALMDPVREAAGRLVESGEIVATQGGVVIELSTAKGPIRLRRKDDGSRTE